MHLALNRETNDLFLNKEEGGVYRVSGGRFVIQQVESKLKTLLGEWLLDASVGYIDLIVDLRHNADLFDLESRLQEIVTSTQGVLSLDTIDMDVKDRSLRIDFTATTIYGVIDTTVPWDNGSILPNLPPPPVNQEVVTHLGQTVTVGGIAVVYTPTQPILPPTLQR